MVNLVFCLLCVGVSVYFVMDNIKTRKRQKVYIADEKKAIRRVTDALLDYTDEDGWYLVVLRWNNTGNSTSLHTFAENGFQAKQKIIENTTGEVNIDYCVTNVIRLSHES